MLKIFATHTQSIAKGNILRGNGISGKQICKKCEPV